MPFFSLPFVFVSICLAASLYQHCVILIAYEGEIHWIDSMQWPSISSFCLFSSYLESKMLYIYGPIRWFNMYVLNNYDNIHFYIEEKMICPRRDLNTFLIFNLPFRTTIIFRLQLGVVWLNSTNIWSVCWLSWGIRIVLTPYCSIVQWNYLQLHCWNNQQ